MDNKKIFAVVAAVLVLGAGVFAYTYMGNSNSADGSNPPGITIDYPKFKGEMNPNVICNIPKAYKFTSDADSKYKTGDAEAKDLQSGIHMYHSDTDIFVQDIVDRIDSVSGNVILIAYYPSSGNPSNLFSVFPELKGQNAISAEAAKTYKIPANEGFTIFSCKASKIYGIKTETEFGSDLPAILKSKADSGWVLMAAKKPASGKDVKKEMKEVNDDNKSKNKPKLKSAWPQKGKGFSFSGSQQPDALTVDSTYKMVWVEMSTEDITKDPTPELTLYATNGSEVSAKKGDTVVLDFIELMSSNKVANVKSIDLSNAGTDTLANLSGYKLFSSTKSDDGKTLKDAKEVTGCTIKPVSLKINVACTTGSLSINPASPLYLELRATIAQTAVLTKTFKLSIASLDDIKIYESGFKKSNYYASPAYTAGGKSAINLPIYWNTYTVSEAAAPAAISVPTGLSFDKISKTLTWDQSTGTVDSYSIEVYSKGVPTILPKVKDNNAKQSLSISGYDSNFAYSFRVKACNGATCSAYSETYVVDVKAPANLVAPTKLAFDTDKKTLAWTDTSTGATKYKVTIESVEYSSLTTSYKFDAYSNTKNYNFGVSACTDQTCSAMSEVLVVAPNSKGIVSKESLVALSAPTKLAFDIKTCTLSWTASTGPVKTYTVEPLIEAKSQGLFPPDTGKTTQTTLGSCSESTSYVFKVKAVDASGKDGPVAELAVPATKVVSAALSAPEKMTVKNFTTNSIELTWDKPSGMPVSNIKGYYLFYGTGTVVDANPPLSSKINVVMNADGSALYKTPETLTPNTNYWFSVKTVDSDYKESAAATLNTAKTKEEEAPKVPQAPSTPTFSDQEDNSVTVNWTQPATDFDPINGYFKIFWQEGGCTNGTGLQSYVAKASTVLTNLVGKYLQSYLSPGTAYGIYLQASNDNKTWSGQSPCAATQTTGSLAQLEAPASFKVTDPTTTSLTLNWTPPAGVDSTKVKSYTISYIDPDAKTVPITPSPKGSDTSFVLTGLKPNTQYVFVIDAVNKSDVKGKVRTGLGKTAAQAIVEVINLYDIINDSYGKCSDSSNGTCKAGETCIEIFGSQHICKTDANAYMYQCNATYTCSGGPYVCWNNYKCAGQASCLDSNGKEVGKASGTGYVCSGTYKCTQGLSCDNVSGSGCTGTKTCQ